jgi:poly(3-hydroxybutyrate) depolymerase
MLPVTAHISRRCRPFQASAVLVTLVSAALSATPVGRPAHKPAQTWPPNQRYTRADLVNPTQTRSIRISYRSHTGSTRPAIVLVPRAYAPGDPAIPMVISPHGRGISYETNASRWGNLPGIGGFAVVVPGGQGDHLARYSWGAGGQVADLARMPDIVTARLPWLRIDVRRIYAFGGSMGGQETLLLMARHPSLLAGAAAIDSLVDFPRQYRNFPRISCNAACEQAWGGPLGLALQKLARTEVGGTPETAKAGFAARSPLNLARAIAKSCLPLQIWWSRTDRVVVDSSQQSGALFRRIRRMNNRAPITGYTGSWAHSAAFRPGRLLPAALAKFDLMPPVFNRKLSGAKVIRAPAGACSR